MNSIFLGGRNIMTKKNFEQNLIRIWDSLRTEYEGSRTCAGVNCHDCPLNILCNPDIGAVIIDAYRYIEIVENWVKEHPVMTEEYKQQEPKVDQQIDTEIEQVCHELHKRYVKSEIVEKPESIEKNLRHEVSELMCLKCLNRWVGVYPDDVLLKNIACKCGEVGYVIKTGQTTEAVIDRILNSKDRK